MCWGRRDLSAALATNVIFGAIDELVTNWLLMEDPQDLVRHLEPLLEFLLEGLEPCDFHGGTRQ